MMVLFAHKRIRNIPYCILTVYFEKCYSRIVRLRNNCEKYLILLDVRNGKILFPCFLCKLIVFLIFHDDIGLSTGTGMHLPIVGNRQQQQGKTDQVGTSTQQLGGPGNLELGELEQLTITNDNESSYDVSDCMNTTPD